MRRASDERLVSALRRGDERAFETIYDRYSGPLLGFCRHMLGSREEAEDALQHVFVAAHRQLLDASRPVQLKPWLYAVARNRCLSMLRARPQTCELEAADHPSTDGLAVADEVERREGVAEMLADLARLPEDQRAALLLSELEDLSHQEIGASLDVPVKRVKALVFQARTTLAGWREARAADCTEIQEQLATLRGSSLRRAPIRRHVAVCEVCAAFEQEVSRQRAAMAMLLPVVPSVALKEGILAAATTGGGAAGAAGAAAGGAAGGAAGAATGGAAGVSASGAAGVGASSIAAKALAVAVVALGGGGGAVAVHEAASDSPARHARPAPAKKHRAADRPAATTNPPAATTSPIQAPPERAGVTAPARDRTKHAEKARNRANGRATAPGRTKAGTGKASAPGQTKTGSGRSSAPGQTKPKGTPPGQTKAKITPPGQAKLKLKQPKTVTPKAPKAEKVPNAKTKAAPPAEPVDTAPERENVNPVPPGLAKK